MTSDFIDGIYILRFLVMLDRLRRGIEKEIPSARDYLRPGLDG